MSEHYFFLCFTLYTTRDIEKVKQKEIKRKEKNNSGALHKMYPYMIDSQV